MTNQITYKQLYILVEGSDEDRFFNSRIMKAIFENKYDRIRIWRYAQEPYKRTKDFLKSVKAMKADYLFLKDINNLPCATAKKEEITNNYKKRVNVNNIIVVIKEIESWYLAGLDNKSCKEIGVRSLSNTDGITKEDFNNRMPKKFDSRIDFMQEILKRFSVEIAKRKNKSFRYFMEKVKAL